MARTLRMLVVICFHFSIFEPLETTPTEFLINQNTL